MCARVFSTPTVFKCKLHRAFWVFVWRRKYSQQPRRVPGFYYHFRQFLRTSRQSRVDYLFVSWVCVCVYAPRKCSVSIVIHYSFNCHRVSKTQFACFSIFLWTLRWQIAFHRSLQHSPNDVASSGIFPSTWNIERFTLENRRKCFYTFSSWLEYCRSIERARAVSNVASGFVGSLQPTQRQFRCVYSSSFALDVREYVFLGHAFSFPCLATADCG